MKSPLLETNPVVGEEVQLTAVFLLPLTVAVNCFVLFTVTAVVAGLIETDTLAADKVPQTAQSGRKAPIERDRLRA